MSARLLVACAAAVLLAAGCAQKADWIGGTLVTVDVTGRWAGQWSNGDAGEFEMTLQQIGPKVTGDVKVIGAISARLYAGPSREPSPATCSGSTDLAGS